MGSASTIRWLSGKAGIRWRAFQRTPKFCVEQTADRWQGSSYVLPLDRVMAAELLLALYAAIAAWLVASTHGWAAAALLLLYAASFRPLLQLRSGKTDLFSAVSGQRCAQHPLPRPSSGTRPEPRLNHVVPLPGRRMDGADNRFVGRAGCWTLASDANQRLLANVRPAGWKNPTPTGKYNLVVVGAGAAGLVAAVGAAGLGARVALLERQHLGGDCLNVGCVPSKTVLRSAKVLGEIARAGHLGVQVGGISVDFNAVMDRMRSACRCRPQRARFCAARDESSASISILARRTSPAPTRSKLVVRPSNFARRRLPPGRRPAVPPIPGLPETGFLSPTNRSGIQTSLPPRLAVIGAWGDRGGAGTGILSFQGGEVTVLDVLPRSLRRDGMRRLLSGDHAPYFCA
jgi:hypothetical protein